MVSDEVQWTEEDIRRCFQVAGAERSAYSSVLPFFETLFTLQETAVEKARPAPVFVAPELLHAKRQGGLPLLERSGLSIDLGLTGELLGHICAAARRANPALAATAERLETLLAADVQVILRGCPKVLADDFEGLKHLAAELNVEADILGFMLYHSLWPSVARHVRNQDGPAAGQDLWDKGYCSMCGSQPMLALLGQEGNRSLVCGFCRHAWPVPRNFCPHCDDRSAKSMEYFFSDSEKEYRVYTCKNCKGYLKSVDLRELARPFYAPLEALLTTHLDLKAQQIGFHTTVPSWQTL